MKQDTQNNCDLFWDFSVALYETEDVKIHCLKLQDQLGLDVNIILLLCWLSSSKYGSLDKEIIEKLCQISLTWQKNILSPMRMVRKNVGGISGRDSRHVYKSLLQSELQAERAEQAVLIQCLDGHLINKVANKTKDHLIENMNLYILSLGKYPNADDIESINYIIDRSLNAMLKS